jgi:acyl transferase domain-containing protein
VRPAALIGHSLGENTAACLAGVFSFEDALALITLRGELLERLPESGMLSVPLSADDISPRSAATRSRRAQRTERFVVSGPSAALEDLRGGSRRAASRPGAFLSRSPRTRAWSSRSFRAS